MTPWRYSDPQTKKGQNSWFICLKSWILGGRCGDLLAIFFQTPLWKESNQKFADNAPTSVTAINVQWLGKLVNEEVIPRDKIVTLHMVSMTYGAQSSKLFGHSFKTPWCLKAPFF